MAAPNLLTLSTGTGKTAVQNVSSTATAILSNSGGSGKVMKINSLIICNINATSSADITVDLYRSSVAYQTNYAITIPVGTTFTAITKDAIIYLEEGDSLRCTASANNSLVGLCSYEELS